MLSRSFPPRTGRVRRRTADNTPPSVSTGTANNGAIRPNNGTHRREAAAVSESGSQRHHESLTPGNIRPLVGCFVRSSVSRCRLFGRSIAASLSSGHRNIGFQAFSTAIVGFVRFGGGRLRLESSPLRRPHRPPRTHCGVRTACCLPNTPDRSSGTAIHTCDSVLDFGGRAPERRPPYRRPRSMEDVGRNGPTATRG